MLFDLDFDIVSRDPNGKALHSPWCRWGSDSKLVVHYGRKVFLFFCRATSSLSVSFFWRPISFCGSSCSSSFKDLAIAASTCASSRFENMTSPKEFREVARKKFIEYCESSQRAMTFSVDLYSSFVGKLIWVSGLVAVPYCAEMACTMSSAVSLFVASRS